MERRFGAVCIAMMSGQGRRRWFYYSKSESGLGEAITAAASKWPAYPLAVKVQRDPRWEQLEKQLLPTAAEFRWNADLSVIQALEEAGDDMKTPRPIEHYAYFPDSTTRRQFVDWLRENDFELDELLVPNDDHPKPGVKFSRISTPELDEVYDQTCLASQGAEECGGDYDGWESQVVKGDS
jgi:hypothetical protein